MALNHISPNKGVDECGAASPASCRFKSARHFSQEAAARIKAGNPQNFYETEAMHEHQAIQRRLKLEGKLRGGSAPAPSPPNRDVSRPTGFPQRSSSDRPDQRQVTLYHKEMGFPKGFVMGAPKGKKALSWSSHAEKARWDDRYGDIPHFDSFSPEKWDVIELGTEARGDGRTGINKIVYRAELDDDYDVTIVVVPQGKDQSGQPMPWIVKTVWLNDRYDSHGTLNKANYAQPKEPAFFQ